MGLRGRRIGEASHPGPVTKEDVEKQLRTARGQLAWLEDARLDCPSEESKEAADEAEAAARTLVRALEEMEKWVDKAALPPAFACPLCFDTKAQREEQIRAGNKFQACIHGFSEDYRAHFLEKHFCAFLTPGEGSERVPVVKDVALEKGETTKNEAAACAATLQRALEEKGPKLERALRRALNGQPDGASDLLKVLKELDAEELRERERGVALGSARDLVYVGQRFAQPKGAANQRLADMLRAVAAVVQAPAAPNAQRRSKNAKTFKSDPLPRGVDCLADALEVLVKEPGKQTGQTKLGRMLYHMEVGARQTGQTVGGPAGQTQQMQETEAKESEQVNAAWLAAVHGAVLLLGGCKPAAVRAKFDLGATSGPQALLQAFVGSGDGVPTAAGPGRKIGYRAALRWLYLGTQDPECPMEQAARRDATPLALEDQKEGDEESEEDPYEADDEGESASPPRKAARLRSPVPPDSPLPPAVEISAAAPAMPFPAGAGPQGWPAPGPSPQGDPHMATPTPCNCAPEEIGDWMESARRLEPQTHPNTHPNTCTPAKDTGGTMPRD